MTDIEKIITESVTRDRLDENALVDIARFLSNPKTSLASAGKNMKAWWYKALMGPNKLDVGFQFMKVANNLSRIGNKAAADLARNNKGLRVEVIKTEMDKIQELGKEASKVEKEYWAWRKEIEGEYGRDPDGLNDLIYFFRTKKGMAPEEIMGMPFADDPTDIPVTIKEYMSNGDAAVGTRIEKRHVMIVLFDYIVEMIDAMTTGIKKAQSPSNDNAPTPEEDNRQWAMAAESTVAVRRHRIVERGNR